MSDKEDPRWDNESEEQKKKAEKDSSNRGSTPPDLEEMLKEFNKRIGDLLTGKSSNRRSRKDIGGNGQQPNGTKFELPPVQFSRYLGVIIVILILVWLASGFYTVNTNQRGVVLRFGKMVQITEPGLNWRFPAPIEKQELVDLTGVRTIEIGYNGSSKTKVPNEALMLTDDENIVDIQFAVQYILNNPENYLFKDRSPDDAVKQVAEASMREIVGKNNMDFVLYQGREEIANQAQENMQRLLDRYQTGVQISKVTMQNAQPPAEVQDAFDDAVKAGQDKVKQENQGEAYANSVIPRAKGTASALVAKAQAYKQSVVARAEGEASRFDKLYAEYRNAPQVTKERMYLDNMQQILMNNHKVVIDAKANNNMLLLPLNQLLQGKPYQTLPDNGANGVSHTATDEGNQQTSHAESSVDYRDRDALRARGNK